MNRYIDADKLQRHGKRGGVVYWRDIEAQPPADVVEVVRCKDCVYREVKGAGMAHWFGCRIMEHNDDDWYCSYGERADT